VAPDNEWRKAKHGISFSNSLGIAAAATQSPAAAAAAVALLAWSLISNSLPLASHLFGQVSESKGRGGEGMQQDLGQWQTRRLRWTELIISTKMAKAKGMRKYIYLIRSHFTPLTTSLARVVSDVYLKECLGANNKLTALIQYFSHS